ncbi:discoidin domain-containing protein [Nibricoccus sp. IMCC34717]|uniref:discoidin domain-containing protein n=1 Tax=Nibricoccus sp. IMCC34717 TaxID=3034021 RepID=UPI003851792A
MTPRLLPAILVAAASLAATGRAETLGTHGGADERTPSRSEYFSWINHTNEGPTAAQTFANLGFFEYLNREYGMVLDIYAFDAGAIDGAGFYGRKDSERFRRQFPEGFGPLANRAAKFGTRLGIWGGPDGFGDTVEEAEARIEQTVALCRDHNFALFKMDAVCGPLRPSKYAEFDRMMTLCRKYTPDLILLNHRLELGPGTRHSTTFLLGGAETYVDVHMANAVTAPHHRAANLARELPPKLTRLTEDHGVCISSCVDFWEDDLILQAFNRSLICAPQVYGSPWLLRDDELPRFAGIFNLHRRYRDLLVNGLVLPEERYGLNAVSRGDGATRLITLRNLSWEPRRIKVRIDDELGIQKTDTKVSVARLFPWREELGAYAYGSEVEVEVGPFRAALVRVSSRDEGLVLAGAPYEVVRETPGRPLLMEVHGLPGETREIQLAGNLAGIASVRLDGVDQPALLEGGKVKVSFPGPAIDGTWHRKLADLSEVPVPGDALALYEATAFAADSNALELRSLVRSGPTAIPEVQRARDAFFGQPLMQAREVSDRYLFDGDPATGFSVMLRWGDTRVQGGTFRLDLGAVRSVTRIDLESIDEFAIQPLKSDEGVTCEVSADLRTWKPVTFLAGTRMKIDLSQVGPWRYLRFNPTPLRLAEVRGWEGDREVRDRSAWRASNLLAPYVTQHWNPVNLNFARHAWSASARLPAVMAKGAYLCIAVNGVTGFEGVTAAVRVDGQLVGCPDRAPSYPSNAWELGARGTDRNYTYYVPLRQEWAGKTVEAVVLGLKEPKPELKPELWLTAHPVPFQSRTLELVRK